MIFFNVSLGLKVGGLHILQSACRYDSAIDRQLFMGKNHITWNCRFHMLSTGSSTDATKNNSKFEGDSI